MDSEGEMKNVEKETKKLKHERKERSVPGINTKRSRNKKKNLGWGAYNS